MVLRLSNTSSLGYPVMQDYPKGDVYQQNFTVFERGVVLFYDKVFE